MHVIRQALCGKSIRIPRLRDSLQCVSVVSQLGYNGTLGRLILAKSETDKDELDKDRENYR